MVTGAGDLDRGSAHFAVTLCEVEVADREERALDVDRQIEPASRDQLADVEIASDLAGRNRPQPVRCRSGDGAFRQLVGDRPATLSDALLALPQHRHPIE